MEEPAPLRESTPGPILIAEDDRDIQEVLREAFDELGVPVEVAGNGAVALAALRAGSRPCLLLVDLMMPVMDGVQLIELIRADPRLAPLPIVLFSADGRAEQRLGGLTVDGFLRKPIDLSSLRELAQRYYGAAEE
jgi:CheY-like chemotaxis protein